MNLEPQSKKEDEELPKDETELVTTAATTSTAATTTVIDTELTTATNVEINIKATTVDSHLSPAELAESYKDWPMKNIREPHDHDVLYGRGGTYSEIICVFV
jgi:hypothetical protein